MSYDPSERITNPLASQEMSLQNELAMAPNRDKLNSHIA